MYKLKKKMDGSLKHDVQRKICHYTQVNLVGTVNLDVI